MFPGASTLSVDVVVALGSFWIGKLITSDSMVMFCSGPRLVQSLASKTALWALMMPNPYLLEWCKPASLTAHESSLASVMLLVSAMIAWTSLQPRFGLASRMRAMIPETVGVAKLVPGPSFLCGVKSDKN